MSDESFPHPFVSSHGCTETRVVVLTDESHISNAIFFYQITASQRGDASHMRRSKIVGNSESGKREKRESFAMSVIFVVFFYLTAGKMDERDSGVKSSKFSCCETQRGMVKSPLTNFCV